MSNIRLASTVLVMRPMCSKSVQGYEIYTIKRPDTMKFLPGHTAFPGGALEEQDFASEWQEYRDDSLRSYDLLPIQITTNAEKELESFPNEMDLERIRNLQHVHRIAALRELFEETGLLLARQKNTHIPIVHSVVQDRTLMDYRDALIHQELTFLDIIMKLGLRLHTESLVQIGKRLTPPSKPIRFDTQFFLTCIPEETVLSPLPGEIAGDDWLEPAKAIQKIETNSIQCAPPTIECFSILASKQEQLDIILKQNA